MKNIILLLLIILCSCSEEKTVKELEKVEGEKKVDQNYSIKIKSYKENYELYEPVILLVNSIREIQAGFINGKIIRPDKTEHNFSALIELGEDRAEELFLLQDAKDYKFLFKEPGLYSIYLLDESNIKTIKFKRKEEKIKKK